MPSHSLSSKAVLQNNTEWFPPQGVRVKLQVTSDIRAGSSNIIIRCTSLLPESALTAPTGPCYYENFHAFELCGAEPHTYYILSDLCALLRTHKRIHSGSKHSFLYLTYSSYEGGAETYWTGFLFTLTCLPYYRRMTVTRPFRQFFAGTAWTVNRSRILLIKLCSNEFFSRWRCLSK